MYEQLLGRERSLIPHDVVGKDKQPRRTVIEHGFPAREAFQFIRRRPISPILPARGGKLSSFYVHEPRRGGGWRRNDEIQALDRALGNRLQWCSRPMGFIHRHIRY